MLPELPAGQVTERPVTVEPQSPGQIAVRLAVGNDPLPGDVARWSVVTIKPRLDITLVDGEPSAAPFESETDFLALALTAGREPWQTRRLADAEWLAAGNDSPDVTILANVATMTPDRVAALERQVRETGMGLVICLGEQVEPELYNRLLWRDGKGLLPAQLARVVDEPAKGLVIDPAEASALDPLRKIAPAALARIETKKFVSVTAQPGDDVRVLAHWNNAAASPAVIEKRFGRGRVVLFTVPADKQWGDWPIDPTYVLTMRSVVASIARGEAYQANTIAGEPLRFPPAVGEPVTNPRVTGPGADQPASATVARDDSGNPLIEFRTTPRAGTYTLAYHGAGNTTRLALFAASPDLSESVLDLISASQLTELLAGLEPSIIRYDERDAAFSPEGREIWRTLALIVLGMFLCESAFAVWVGRER
jgi:hypothetical protein